MIGSTLHAAAYGALAVLCFMAALAFPFPLSLALIVAFVAADFLLIGDLPRRPRASDERATRMVLYPQHGRSSRIADDRELRCSREVAP